MAKIVKKEGKYFLQKKAGSSEATNIGIQCETEEHPKISPDMIKILVADHLKEDPHYYDEYKKDHEPDAENAKENKAEGGKEELADKEKE